MELRTTFNENEYNYDKARPDYPKELFDDIFNYINLSKTSNALEIGIGTGQATLPFLNKGCNVAAVELGDRLAKYCQQKFSRFNNFCIYNSDFIEIELPKRSFELIYSATAFHWIPKDSGYAKVKSLLKPGGVVALFWNHPFVSSTDDETNLASMYVYEKYRPDDKTPKEFDLSKCQEQIEELEKYGFTDIKSKIYKRIRRLTSEEYISLINTYSDHIALPKEVRNAFEIDMKQAIDNVGGVINIYDTIDLYLAKNRNLYQVVK